MKTYDEILDEIIDFCKNHMKDPTPTLQTIFEWFEDVKPAHLAYAIIWGIKDEKIKIVELDIGTTMPLDVIQFYESSELS